MSGSPSLAAPGFETLADALAARVLAAGRGWIVIDKPDWLSSHNADSGNDAPDELWTAREMDAVGFAREALARLAALRATVRPDPDFAPAPAHRLDVGASGILAIACARPAARALPAALAQAQKTYLAIARGHPRAAAGPGSAAPGDALAWRWSLSERAEGRRAPQGPSSARQACETQARVLRANRWFTWLEAEPVTGRTHQIRRHAALAGAPLLGDRRYGDPKHADMIASRYGVARLALHAARLDLSSAAPSDLRDFKASIEAPTPREFAAFDQAPQGQL